MLNEGRVICSTELGTYFCMLIRTLTNITYWELLFVKINDEWKLYSVPRIFVIAEMGVAQSRKGPGYISARVVVVNKKVGQHMWTFYVLENVPIELFLLISNN